MKKAISTLLFTFVLIGVMAETVERGSVKEYRGTEDKTALSGVELQVKGAQSTISDADGSFELHFATLKPGEKVSYTDIYKDGYVIFNKDALDAWRISNNGRPFTIVMCREADFRALKKKFYGIIEKSYYQEYLRQRELAAKTALTAQQLESRLREVENDYNEKMSNINNYVELFSRIDRNEMDSVEAKALAFMENGQIDEAIKTYEELQLRKEMDFQFSKWDAADEMRRAANGMESEAQADLLALVDKMQKQISLYQMGGSEYDVKRFEMMGNLISLLYRLRPITEGVYNETLGKLIVEKANCAKSSDRISAYREAAALPSVAGLWELARRYQVMPPSEERTDTIKSMYRQALGLLTAENDSLRSSLQADLGRIPDGYYHHSDGNSYPYRLLPGNKALLMGEGPWFSAHLEGEVELPSFINSLGRADTVVGLDEFAFGRNKNLYKVKLPQHCRFIGIDVFKGCDSLTLVVNPELEEIYSTKVSETIPRNTRFLIPGIPRNDGWITAMRANTADTDTTHNAREFAWAQARYNEEKQLFLLALPDYWWLFDLYWKEKNVTEAKKVAQAISRINKTLGYFYFSFIYDIEGDYEKAYKCAVKGQNHDYPYTYNRLAYILADPKYGKSDFPKAHKSIDKAISLAQTNSDKANFIDTKGELYLIEGNVDEAKKCLDLALSVYPQYNQGVESRLYAYFHPEANDNALQNDEEAKLQMEESDRLQRFRNISIALLARDFLNQRSERLPDNCKGMIDEMVGYIARLRSEDQGFKLDARLLFYSCLQLVATRVHNYCKIENIPFINEWVGLIDMDGSAALDKHVRSSINNMMMVHQMASRLPAAGLFDNDVKLIYVINKCYENYLNLHMGEEGEVTKDLMDGFDVPYLKEKFGYDCGRLSTLIKEIDEFVDKYYAYYIYGHADELGKIPFSKGLATGSIEEVLQKTGKSNDMLRGYIDLVQRAAKVAHRKLPQWNNFRVVDYEELVSIGILAVQVLIKNKTPEQLAKYNEIYIATAVAWAIGNELKIRYPWYDYMLVSDASYIHDLAKQSEAAGIDYQRGQVRLAVYKVLAQIGNTYGQLTGGPLDFVIEGESAAAESELQKMWRLVKGCRDKMPGKYLECYDAFFAPDADYINIQYRYSPVIIQGMFNEIKAILNGSGMHGY